MANNLYYRIKWISDKMEWGSHPTGLLGRANGMWRDKDRLLVYSEFEDQQDVSAHIFQYLTLTSRPILCVGTHRHRRLCLTMLRLLNVVKLMSCINARRAVDWTRGSRLTCVGLGQGLHLRSIWIWHHQWTRTAESPSIPGSSRQSIIMQMKLGHNTGLPQHLQANILW